VRLAFLMGHPLGKAVLAPPVQVARIVGTLKQEFVKLKPEGAGKYS
jgi:hypothetical protein